MSMFNRMISEITDKINKLVARFNLIEEQLVEDKQKSVARAVIDANIEILSAAYDRAMAYTQVIIIAGYASFFGLWSLTKEYLTKGQVFWSAIVMSISIVTFVVFEVYKMYLSGHSLLLFQNVIAKANLSNNPNDILEAVQNFNKKNQRMTLRLGRIWHVVLFVAVITGLAAIAIMFYSFITGLIRTYS